MYRQHMEEQRRIMEDQQFINQLGKIPVVSSAWTQAYNLYQRTKGSHELLKSSLNMAEAGVKTVVDTSVVFGKPLVERYQPQIVEKANSYACEKLNQLEEKYPVINKPTEELMEDGKQMYDKYVKPTVDRVVAVKDFTANSYNTGKEQIGKVKQIGSAVTEFGCNQVAKTMDTPYGQFVSSQVNNALDFSEQYVEKYLPESDSEDEENVEKEEMDEYPPNAVTRATCLTGKVRKRMYNKAMRDMKRLQLRSQENLAKLSFTVDLIQYAKTNIETATGKVTGSFGVVQDKMTSVWSQIVTEEDDVQDVPKTLEGQSIAVARNLTKKVKIGITTLTSYIPESVQITLKDRIDRAKQYSDELIKSFQNVNSYEEVPSWLLAQAQDKMGYVQETVNFLTEYLLSKPLDWLSPEFDLDGINLADPVMDLSSNGHAPHVPFDGDNTDNQ
ncbi:perilipin-2-like isoform X1 [Mytilus galloprovincialis]|uniref:perilipin-2-like isoform X1 n=1 Tax=Mytilus galloprovincialis TaxID=29158 RepID=UPI003F7BD98E